MNTSRSDRSSSRTVRAGRILAILVAAFLIFVSGSPKLILHPSATDSFVRFGFDPAAVSIPLGILEVSIAILYVIPRTSVLGAILLTGLLGGATVTHLRVGDPIFFPIIFGGFAWLAIYLQDARVRELLPLRRNGSVNHAGWTPAEHTRAIT